MVLTEHIKISKETKKKLDLFKLVSEETYNSVIQRLLKDRR